MTDHTLSLTNGAAHILGQLAGTPGILNDAVKLYRVGAFAETHLIDLVDQPEAPAKDASATDWSAFRRRQIAWTKDRMQDIVVRETTRDALKDLLTAASSKGLLPASAAVAPLIEALGLAPKE